jgi:predicted site-specific integrase-resolvase
MKLSTYAKQLGISYQTAWRLFKDGKLNAYKLPTGTVIVREKSLRARNNPRLFTVAYLLRRTRATWNYRRVDFWTTVLRKGTR